MQTSLPPITKINAVEIQNPKNFVGTFTVIHKSGITKFPILDLAIKFYNELSEEATIWDVTNGYELIKFKIAG